MWVADDEGCSPMRKGWFNDALFVFAGEATCCRLGHTNGMSSQCDRESLVLPVLGLYGELYASSRAGSGSRTGSSTQESGSGSVSVSGSGSGSVGVGEGGGGGMGEDEGETKWHEGESHRRNRQRMWEDVRERKAEMFPADFTFVSTRAGGARGGWRGGWRGSRGMGRRGRQRGRGRGEETRVLFGDLIRGMEDLVDSDTEIRDILRSVGRGTGQGARDALRRIDSVVPVHGMSGIHGGVVHGGENGNGNGVVHGAMTGSARGRVDNVDRPVHGLGRLPVGARVDSQGSHNFDAEKSGRMVPHVSSGVKDQELDVDGGDDPTREAAETGGVPQMGERQTRRPKATAVVPVMGTSRTSL